MEMKKEPNGDTQNNSQRQNDGKKGDQILIDKAVSLAQNKVNYKFRNEYI